MRSVMMALLMLSTCVYAQTRIRAVYINLSTGVLANCVPRYNTSTQLFDCVPVSASITLSGDVTGVASATVVALVGGRSAASVASTVDTVASATSLATASTLVRRDASGNFAANLITGSLIGNASSATALSVAPFVCPSGQFARGVTVNGDAIGCAAAGGGGGGTWGSIIGTLSAQTDLQAAINLKANLSSPILTGDPQAPNVSASDSDSSIVNSASAQAMIDAKTIAGTGSADAYKTAVLKANGTEARLAYYSYVEEIIIDGGGSPLTAAGSCTIRDLPSSGRFSYVALSSISGSATTPTDLSGSVTIRFYTSPRFGSTTWTAIGDVSLSSESSKVDSTLTGWTTNVAAASRLAVCVVGTATAVTKLIVSPGFNADPA